MRASGITERRAESKFMEIFKGNSMFAGGNLAGVHYGFFFVRSRRALIITLKGV
jgi:hypothetical protein